MRLFSIAEEAIVSGIKCVFVGNCSQVPWLEVQARNIGFELIVTPTDFQSWDSDDVLIIDSYDIQAISSFIGIHTWSRIIAISDYHTPEFESDLTIYPGLTADWFHGNHSKFLSGVDYIPLRKSIRKIKIDDTSSVKSIVVIGGGTDSLGFCKNLAKVLSGNPHFNSATFFSAEMNEIQSLDKRFSVKAFGPSLDEAIEKADLVFSTAGTTSLEIIARGLPTGIACAIQNQQGNYLTLHALGVAAQIGERLPDGTWRFSLETISRLVVDSHFRLNLISQSNELIDLKGSGRIVRKIIETIS